MCALLENFQMDDGLAVLEVLGKYIPNQPASILFARQALGREAELPMQMDKVEVGE